MISTEQFLALLEEKQLLSARAVAHLLPQIAQSDQPIAAETIAKRLIKHGHLTVAQAKRVPASPGRRRRNRARQSGVAKPSAKPRPKAEEDRAWFPPLDDEPTEGGPPSDAGPRPWRTNRCPVARRSKPSRGRKLSAPRPRGKPQKLRQADAARARPSPAPNGPARPARAQPQP